MDNKEVLKILNKDKCINVSKTGSIIINSEAIDTNCISDGSHTFGELYDHRCILFSIICNVYKDKAWKSFLHSDGTMFPGYFIVGIETPEGNYTYHYCEDKWDLFNVQELEYAPEWDGHRAKDITRLLSLLTKGEK